jgi:hypothetical protein
LDQFVHHERGGHVLEGARGGGRDDRPHLGHSDRMRTR